MRSKKKFNEIDLVTFREMYEKTTPSFFYKVIDHYFLWEFTRESLETLVDLCDDIYNYIRFITDGEENEYINKESLRNRVEKMFSDKKFYSKIFGLGDLSKKHLYILRWAIYFLSQRNRDALSQLPKNYGLFPFEFEDFKDDSFPVTKKGPSPFDSLTDEEFSEIEDYVYHSFVVE